MANSYMYLSILLLFSFICVSGRVGSESTYSCDLQSLIASPTIPLGNKHEGKLTDCIQIGWIESQKQLGLKTGESAECSKALSSKCQKTDQLTSSNDKIVFIKTIGNDAVGLKANCTIDLDDALKKPINVWQCGDDVLHRYYILTSASHPQSTSISKRVVRAIDGWCDPMPAAVCLVPMERIVENPAATAQTKEQLIEMCKVVKPAIRCLSDVLTECSNAGRFNLQPKYYGVIPTFTDLCNLDSQFSKDYVKYVPCMREVDDRVRTCSKVKAGDRSSSSDESDSREIFCCAMKRGVECAKDVYSEHCGAGAGQLGYRLTKMRLQPIYKATCIDSNGNFKCSGCNSLSMSVVTSLLSLSTLFFIFRRIEHF